MDIWDKSNFLIFIVFVIPGFLSMKMYSILHPNTEIDTTKAIVEVVSCSRINYAIWFTLFILLSRAGIFIAHLHIVFSI